MVMLPDGGTSAGDDAAGARDPIEIDVHVGEEPREQGLIEVEVRVGADEPEGETLVEVELIVGDPQVEVDEDGLVTCADCRGTGVYVGLLDRKPCPTCDGRGRIASQ